MQNRERKAALILLVVAVAFLASVDAKADTLNVSCGDSIKSLNKTATVDFEVNCPLNCTSGSVWGTDLYTTDSAICVAAVHSGVIKEAGGSVRVTLAPGQPAYTGSLRNGVTTGNWGAYDQSFKVASPATVTPSNNTNISCNDSVKSLNKTATMDFSVVCPVNCTSGSIWGTDLYTTDSSICRAGIHAGVIAIASGGPVHVMLVPGQGAYTGSARNGVTTQKWGKYDKSFKVLKQD